MFEWDEKKRNSNFIKHGSDFEDVWELDWEHAIRTPDGRYEYGEFRFAALGEINGRLHVCIYVMRNNKYRIISLRKANKREEKFYDQKTHQ